MVSVVVLPLSRLVDVTCGGFGLPRSPITEQVQAAQRVTGQLLALHVVLNSLSQASIFGLLQEAGTCGVESGCIAASRVTGSALNFRPAQGTRAHYLHPASHVAIISSMTVIVDTSKHFQ